MFLTDHRGFDWSNPEHEVSSLGVRGEVVSHSTSPEYGTRFEIRLTPTGEFQWNGTNDFEVILRLFGELGDAPGVKQLIAKDNVALVRKSIIQPSPSMLFVSGDLAEIMFMSLDQDITIKRVELISAPMQRKTLVCKFISNRLFKATLDSSDYKSASKMNEPDLHFEVTTSEGLFELQVPVYFGNDGQ